MNIYLDNNATTPIHPEAKKAIIAFLDYYGNPSSMHLDGRMVKEKIKEAKENICKFLNVNEEDLIFTSCGSESNNTILKSILYWSDEKRHLITSSIEHPAILETAKFLQKQNVKVDYLPIDNQGLVNLDELEKLIKQNNNGIVSIMYANNEIGTIQPLNEISKTIKKYSNDIIFHSDIVQAAGKIRISLKDLPIDCASISGHKLYAPKGIGLLYIKNFNRNKNKFTPLIHGGHQESGFRAGTENTLGIIALGASCKALSKELEEEILRIENIRDYFEKKIEENISDIIINGKNSPRVPGTSNITFKYVEGESILLKLDLYGYSVSTGSACSTGSLEPSHVLMALHKDPEMAHGSIRFSFGRENKLEEIDSLVVTVKKVVEDLREISPIYKK